MGKVEFVSSSKRYTGLFQGASYGIVRISLAKKPSESIMHTVPGMGLKFLRDGIESGSLVALYSVEGQESWNVFANNWSNHVPGATDTTGADVLAVATKFATATPNTQQVGLSDMARHGEDGVLVPDNSVNYPYKLVFK